MLRLITFHPCDSSQWGPLWSHSAATDVLCGGRNFFPPPPDMILGVKGSGCHILGGRSRRVQGLAESPHPIPVELYHVPWWSSAGRPGSWSSSPHMSHSCGAERPEGANTPKLAPTNPEGFGTRAGWQSLNKCATAALQPQICEVSQPRGWHQRVKMPLGMGEPDQGMNESLSLHSYDFGAVELILVAAWREGKGRECHCPQLCQVRGIPGGTGDVEPLSQDLQREQSGEGWRGCARFTHRHPVSEANAASDVPWAGAAVGDALGRIQAGRASLGFVPFL